MGPSLRTLAVVVAALCCWVAGAAGQQRKPKPPDPDQFRCWFLGATIVEFGYYDPFLPNDLSIQGHLEFQCSTTTGPPTRSIARDRPSGRAKGHRIEISFSTGLGGDYDPRSMTGTGTDRLQYNLYRDSACTQIWGDGTRGSRARRSSRPARRAPLQPAASRVVPRPVASDTSGTASASGPRPTCRS